MTRKPLPHFSLQTKLTRISVVSIMTAMAVMLIVMMAYEFYFFRNNQATDLSVQSHIIEYNSSAALAFNDPIATTEALSALRTSPSVDRAEIYLADGTPFAAYSKPGTPIEKTAPRPTWYGTQFTWSKLVISQAIQFKDHVVGQLVIEANFRLLYKHVLLYGVISLLAVTLALIFALLLLKPLIRSITQPILNMNNMMKSISTKMDYSVRMHYFAQDEVGQLAAGFNEMLGQMQLADTHEKSQSRMMEMLANGEHLNNVLEAIVASVASESMQCGFLLFNHHAHFTECFSANLAACYVNFVKKLDISQAPALPEPAAYLEKRVIVDNIKAHPKWDPYQKLPQGTAFNACWLQPMLSSTGQRLGVFFIVNQEARSPGISDIMILEQSAYLARIAIERDKADAELKIAATAFQSQDSLMITDANCVILRVNQAFTDSTGYTAEEVVGKNPRILQSGVHNADFYRVMWDTITKTGTWQGEIWGNRKSGELFPKWLTISAVKGNCGNVTHYVGSHIDITQRKVAEEEIKTLAFYDALTGLPNRRLLLDRLSHALATSARTGLNGAVLFIDLDNFKTLNDTLGHDVGDLLLKEVAQRLSANSREDDTISRIGGDEFVVILENLSHKPSEAAEHAQEIGDKFLAALNAPYLLGTHECRSSISVGITLFNDHQFGIEDLLKQADIAMYQAKKAGRNSLRFFDPQMQDAISYLVNLERELRVAIEQQQFKLHFQIQVDTTNKIVGAEALIRWLHPERGLVSPLVFIAVAEENGMILQVGLWFLDQACAQLKLWAQSPYTSDLSLSINVSARQLHQEDFVTQVKAALQRHAVNPALLKLEITESMLLANIDDTIKKMHLLKEIGVQFSLDDFGTGYSSLQYLKQLPLTQLKIDKSFVQDIAANISDQAIVQTIIVMAQALNLSVIAEGVETSEQRDMLLSIGCRCYQGFLFSEALPIEPFEAMFRQRAAIQ